MALELDSRYPGRFNPGDADYPQGSFKNRTAPGALDGSYLEKDWANDKEGFFQRLMLEAGLAANGVVDTALESQYYDALMRRISAVGQNIQVISAAGVTAWPVPQILQGGTVKAKVTVVGGGGGGGGAGSATGAAGGGGGGGASGFRYVDLTGITSVSVTVGAGGSGGVGIATAPTAGGSSSFGPYISCSGGGAGANSSGGSVVAGAGGSTVTGADVAILGSGGRYSLVNNGVFAAGGAGGDSLYGRGNAAPNLNGTAVAQVPGVTGQRGAGGSGGASYNASGNGGAGGAGIVVIEW